MKNANPFEGYPKFAKKALRKLLQRIERDVRGCIGGKLRTNVHMFLSVCTRLEDYVEELDVMRDYGDEYSQLRASPESWLFDLRRELRP